LHARRHFCFSQVAEIVSGYVFHPVIRQQA